MREIKVGDKVKCVKGKSNADSRWDLPQNSTYTVTEIGDQGSLRLLNAPQDSRYCRDRFVLVTTKIPENLREVKL